MIKRKDIIDKLILKENIKKLINQEYKTIVDEEIFRGYVRQIILKEAKTRVVPFHSTGIAVLANVLKKVIPILHDDYISLTTDKMQRRSFRAHTVNGVKNSLSTIRAMRDKKIGQSVMAAEPDEATEKTLGHTFSQTQTPEDDGSDAALKEAEVKVKDTDGDGDIDGDSEKDERFIDIDRKPEDDDHDEEASKFNLPEEDETGRNVAIQSFKKIEKTIADAYELLAAPSDREDFYDYLIANLKLYFDRWEEELLTTVPEPTVG